MASGCHSVAEGVDSGGDGALAICRVRSGSGPAEDGCGPSQTPATLQALSHGLSLPWPHCSTPCAQLLASWLVTHSLLSAVLSPCVPVAPVLASGSQTGLLSPALWQAPQGPTGQGGQSPPSPVSKPQVPSHVCAPIQEEPCGQRKGRSRWDVVYRKAGSWLLRERPSARCWSESLGP